jgi:predicted Zn-dependent protease
MFLLKRWIIVVVLCSSWNVQADVSNAIVSLLSESFKQYDAQKYEQAAALLERALGIDVRNPILWHNLAGVRLKQEDWKRAADLATKSNTLIVGSEDQKGLRIRNFMLIALACEGMQEDKCANEARKRAYALAKN